MNKATLAVLLGCMTVIAACTKEVPYKEEFKDQVLETSLISENEDYNYNTSALEMSRYAADGRPFWFGDNKVVRLEWTETSLKVIEKERDARFSNPINDKLILEIPIERVDYECAKDSYGDCTNTEAEKKAVWSQKTKFKIKPAEAKQGAIEFLPILSDGIDGEEKCFTEISSAVQSYEITADAINLQVKRNYQQNLNCMKEIDNSLSETSVTAIFHYSLVKSSRVLSKDFKPVNYSKVDEDTFGFFSSTYKKRDVDTNQVEKSEKTVMNHWNPNRKVIDYHLSDSFNKPSNRKLKAATYLAVERLNEGLKLAGAQFQVVLHEPSGKNPGDIRNSMIVLVEDPYEGAPLGYGPQTEDPVTGEIISARTIMYLAGLQQYAKINYEDIGRAMKRAKLKAEQAAAIAANTDSEDDGSTLQTEEGDGSQGNSLAKIKKSSRHNKVASGKKPLVKTSPATLARLEKERTSLKNYTSRINDEYASRDAKSYIKYITEAKNCSFRAEPVGQALSEVRPELMELLASYSDGNGGLKAWTSLSTDEKQAIMDTLIPEVWLPVLLHELGHNMGLRHNFKGSEDKENFFSKEELQARGVNHQVPYSTIMEYGDDLRTLPFLGKYDVAALKFAYARKVDVKDKAGARSEIAVTTDLKDLTAKLEKDGSSLVEFGYCTDEHVGPNAGCRRFDEGISLTDIAQYLVDSYEDRYEVRAMRSGRENFSSMENLAYLRKQKTRFMDMRVFSETYERIKHLYNLADNDEAFETVDWLKDLKQAVLLTNRLMMKVISTPDLHCAISLKAKPNQIIAIQALATLDKDAFDCWTASLNSQYLIVGQTGKSFNDKKHPDNENNYIDQIDVRGFWMDKYAAASALFVRDISSSFNRNFDNAWDIADLKPEIADMLASIIENKRVTVETFTLNNGQEMDLKFRYDFNKAHIVSQPLDSRINRSLKIANGNIAFSEILANLAVGIGLEGRNKTSARPDDLANAAELKDLVSVKVVSNLNDGTPPGFLSLDVGSDKIYASSLNLIAHDMLTDVTLQRGLSGIKDEDISKLDDLIQEAMKEGGKALTPEELAAAIPALTKKQTEFIVLSLVSAPKLTAQKINDLASGLIMSEADIVNVLMGLPNL